MAPARASAITEALVSPTWGIAVSCRTDICSSFSGSTSAIAPRQRFEMPAPCRSRPDRVRAGRRCAEALRRGQWSWRLRPTGRDPRGSSGCFGYSGGQGGVVQTVRSIGGRQLQEGKQRLWLVAHGGPRVTALGDERRNRANRQFVRVDRVDLVPEQGVETWAPTRGRANQAPKMVLCGAFWLKSMNTRRLAPPSTNSP